MAAYSIYVEKKPVLAVEAHTALQDLRQALSLTKVTGLRIINRYLVENFASERMEEAVKLVFSDPSTDMAFMSMPIVGAATVLAVEPLPSQFDQRAESCAENLALLSGGERPLVRSAKIYVLEGEISPEEFLAIKKHFINPVEARETLLTIPDTLQRIYAAAKPVPRIDDFTKMEDASLTTLRADLGLAMDGEDLRLIQTYFRDTEQRNPSETELRMLDTYWSDHCRHTTFFTQLEELTVEDPEIEQSKERYFALREKLYAGKERPITLMDLATIGARALKAEGSLTDLEESEEVNACSVHIAVDVDGVEQDWLLLFKNETHNHPTEIEPFGGASTCLGGAIRDPLSGRGYVYQAMRITGAGNPLAPASKTLEGKLPQRTLVRTAAEGYSSYGNQIGAATGHVHEIYHKDYVAKRMELGAVLAAVATKNVVREVPVPGDKVLLVGGRTGNDGLGGATGSSRSLTTDSAEERSAEVQKGNAPEERKIVRLFRTPAVSRLIKRSNDFGAGGVSVAIGELADGILVDLDSVPTKYPGMSGTEIALSESQERMAVVVAAKDVEAFLAFAEAENVETTVVAEITENPRLVMVHQGDTIVDISREFLSTSGTTKYSKATIAKTRSWNNIFREEADAEEIKILLGSLEHAAQHGLVQRFDASAGGNTVLMPYGGAYQMTPAQAMVAKIPVLEGVTNTASVMGWGFDPVISKHSPYHGAMLAVIDSVARLLAGGGTRSKAWLTFQEYFERLGNDPYRWGKPAAALLGALDAQMALGLGSVGGKDSMSGSFEELDVPPTLVSFAVSITKADAVVSPEFKQADSPVYLLAPSYDSSGLVPSFESLCTVFDTIEKLLVEGKINAIWAVGTGGTAKAISLMGFGNRLGFAAEKPLTCAPLFGAFVLETQAELPELEGKRLGSTTSAYELVLASGERTPMKELEHAWTTPLLSVFPVDTPEPIKGRQESYSYETRHVVIAKTVVAKPKVTILVLPGAFGEDTMEKGFRAAGADPTLFIVQNATPAKLAGSIKAFAAAVKESHILAIPDGMTGGGEPEGAGKFITAFLRHAEIKAAITDLMENREGLILGIGDGFHGLLQLGLVPYGEYREPNENSPAFLKNPLGRHQSQMVQVRVSSNKSPWLAGQTVGAVHTLPLSTGQGSFLAIDPLMDELAQNGQIAGQYVGQDGLPSYDIRWNPTGSFYAIEGLLSPDGRIYGRMAAGDRTSENLYKNIPNSTNLDMFRGAVEYFTK